MKFPLFLSFFSTGAAFAALPAVGPDYRRPDVSAPAAYRDAGDAALWKTAAPADTLARGEWWRRFGDPALDGLEARALAANQDLRSAAARVAQAMASAGIARSAYWPQVAANPSFTREQTSTTVSNPLPQPLGDGYRAPLVASWELDLFGRVRRLGEGARAEADAAAASFESFRLALTSEVAADYFSLRALGREAAILAENVDLRRRALDLIRSRLTAGAATELDLARAEADLATTEADAAELAGRRAALQNALAVLVGENASTFSLEDSPVHAVPLAVPAGLPSELLERRPDVAAAERALAAANARIGVAQAAFFPAISLTGSAGFASEDSDRLFQHDSRLWSIGPALYLPVFQGGRNRANLARSRAAYDESVAAYRQSLLVAFREVQDALTATRLLADQAAAQDRAAAAAERAAQLARTRYDAGYVSYLEVLDAQRTALSARRTSTQLTAQRLNTSVALIKALGGGWHTPPAGPALAQR